MKLPSHIDKCISLLNQAGFEAYAVGGCVRDSLLNREPEDWDITTSALPRETKEVFRGCTLIETGIKHGTVTVLFEGNPTEITTYRLDGDYTDHRHPDSVEFTNRLRDDLSRRDFTVNAMAYSESTGIVDAFGGQADLNMGLIRCVGEPDRRFNEDALRILRALRFSSVLGFSIEKETAKSIHEDRELLKNVSAERVFSELKELLCGKNVYSVLMGFPDVFSVVLPEIAGEIGFDQKNFHHVYTLWEHTCVAVSKAPCIFVIRLTMLLHDCGKPLCQSFDEKGVAHYYSHAEKSRELAERALTRLKADKATTQQVLTLILMHDNPLLCEERLIKRRLNQIGEPMLKMLIEVKKADNLALCESFGVPRVRELESISRTVDDIMLKESCFSVKDLSVNGTDLIAMGLKGREIGKMLELLLNAVMDEKVENERSRLLEYARLNYDPIQDL